jgi:hypothetical protein
LLNTGGSSKTFYGRLSSSSGAAVMDRAGVSYVLGTT